MPAARPAVHAGAGLAPGARAGGEDEKEKR